jgi:hypothetical protein
MAICQVLQIRYMQTPVVVSAEYPYGRGTDEGQSHFRKLNAWCSRTPGYISYLVLIKCRYFADGMLRTLRLYCNVIVDDITYNTEPFFMDGPVAKAAACCCSGVPFYPAGNSRNQILWRVFTRAAGNNTRRLYWYGNTILLEILFFNLIGLWQLHHRITLGWWFLFYNWCRRYNRMILIYTSLASAW